MMKKLLLLLLLIPVLSYSQTIDTVLNKGIYKSYYSIGLKQPLYVSYKLWKGGGNCSRAGFRFKNDTSLPMATQKDYSGSGYDQGHLANAEDFASDCIKDELTFRFYNCLPQTPNLNRGVWKKWETVIRVKSQQDSLLVITGGIFTSKKTIGNGVRVPDQCWKVVKSLTTGEIKHVLLFNNSNPANVIEMDLENLKGLLDYDIKLDW